MPAAKASELAPVILDPVKFSRGILCHDPWPVQQQILRSVATNRWTSVKACHASGKTFTAADAVLWWVTRFKDGIAVTTAPTWTQVEKLLWGEIRKSVGSARIKYPIPSQTELKLGPNRYAVGLSTNEGVRFQGWHGRILIVLDEAPGVLPEIYESIEGIRAGGYVHVLELGNPTVASGPFHDSFSSNRMNRECITISAFDTPNLAGLTLEGLLSLPDAELDRNPKPYLTTRRWVREKYDEWGEGHPLWQARVMGQFPDQAEDSLISLAWIEAARSRSDIEGPQPERAIHAGLDVAGPGEDETVLTLRRGNNIIGTRAWANPDPRGDVISYLTPFRAELAAVNVDSAGIGWGMYTHLKELGWPAKAINVGESPLDSEKYVNLKAELYWGLRMRFQSGTLSGLSDDRAVSQLASLRYKHNARGQVVIESKDDMRRRGVKSPDRAEALMLAYARPSKPTPNISFI